MATAPRLYSDRHNEEHSDEHAQVDDFGALEERVLRMVELVRSERRERQRAEETAATLQQLLDEQSSQLEQAQQELRGLERDRDLVRGRVERMLKQLDQLDS